MKYISTRGKASALDFENVLLAGLAPDGGLYVPQEYPRSSTDEIRKMQGAFYDGLLDRIRIKGYRGGRLRQIHARRRRSVKANSRKSVGRTAVLRSDFGVQGLRFAGGRADVRPRFVP